MPAPASKPPARLRSFVILAGLILLCVIGWFVLRSRNEAAGKINLCRAELRVVLAALRDYQSQYGECPAGDGPDILKTLLGDNPKGVIFLNIRTQSLGADFSLKDPWRVAYRLEGGSSNSVTIRSAGPNRRFGDVDDIVNER